MAGKGAANNRAAVSAGKKKPPGKPTAVGGEKSARKDVRRETAKQAPGSAANLRAKFFLDKPLKKFTPTDRGLVLARIETLRKKPVTQRFLDTIQRAEDGGPGVMVGRRYRIFRNVCRVPNLKKHPGEVLPYKCFYRPRKGGRYSTASGNYQITRQNWRELAPFLALSDFSPANQQRAALELMRRGGGARSQRVKQGFLALEKGRINSAIVLGTQDWASSTHSTLPGRKMDYRPIAEKIRAGKISVNNGLELENDGPKHKRRLTVAVRTSPVEKNHKGPNARIGPKNSFRR
jgi:muramidase (phage lysozyme)